VAERAEDIDELVGLNYYWWYKIGVGCLKGLGVLPSSSKAKK
jgi:hypothetical protein